VSTLRTTFVGKIDRDIPVQPTKSKSVREDGSYWQGRIAVVSGKFYVGSLAIDSVLADGTLAADLPEAVELVNGDDFVEMHGVSFVQSLEGGADTEISFSLAGLPAGTVVSAKVDINLEAADRGLKASCYLRSPFTVIQRASQASQRASRLALLRGAAVEPAKNGKS
jgi:hypothetical protein